MKKNKLPRHVAIMMDGNRRWARKKGLSALGGHNYVVDEMLEPIVDRCIEFGIPYLTLWAFSTENWKRSKWEINGIMRIFRGAMDRKAKDLFEKGVKLRVLGDMSRFPKDIQKMACGWVETSKDNKAMTVNVALNYGGRDEILRAIGKMVKSEDFTVEKIDTEYFERFLDTAGMPDPDLIIRTGGTERLSGFMMWQAEYAELYFPEILMPELKVEEFDRALAEYGKRKRRFGGGNFKDYKK